MNLYHRLFPFHQQNFCKYTFSLDTQACASPGDNLRNIETLLEQKYLFSKYYKGWFLNERM